MNTAMTIKVVAFDVNGTLMQWPRNRVQAWEVQQLLADFGIPISYQAFKAARAGVFAFVTPKREIEGWTDFLALLFAQAGVPVSTDLLACLTAMYESRDQMELFPEACATLDIVRGFGVKTCTFTTLPRFMLDPSAGELQRRLDDYFNCSSVGQLKGDPRFYQGITARLGVQPAEILCVGDDWIGDCLIPRQVGWQAILLDRHAKNANVQAGQLATITTLAELPDIVRDQLSFGKTGSQA